MYKVVAYDSRGLALEINDVMYSIYILLMEDIKSVSWHEDYICLYDVDDEEYVIFRKDCPGNFIAILEKEIDNATIRSVCI